MIQVTRTSNHDLPLPNRSSHGAAGYDLRAVEDVFLNPTNRACIGTGFSFEIPPGKVGMIRPRSGLAVMYGIDVMAGVVDSDYRGEVKVVLVNHGDDPMIINKGDRIAQMIVHDVYQGLVAETNWLSRTQRAADGFGSTGVK